MKLCASCKKEVVIDKYFTRKSNCPHCGEDLHICLNCRFYLETKHNKCLEERAEHQRTRDKANFCDYFRFTDTLGIAKKDAPADETKKRFDELFKKN